MERQKQRLSIARIVLAETPVLLLDEAIERRELQKIIIHDRCRTVIVTAHRPGVLARCDRVYPVGGGCLEAIGEDQR